MSPHGYAAVICVPRLFDQSVALSVVDLLLVMLALIVVMSFLALSAVCLAVDVVLRALRLDQWRSDCVFFLWAGYSKGGRMKIHG